MTMLAQVVGSGSVETGAIIGAMVATVLVLVRLIEALLRGELRRGTRNSTNPGPLSVALAGDDAKKLDRVNSWTLQHGERMPVQLDKIGEACQSIAVVLTRSQEIWKEIHARQDDVRARTVETRQDVSAMRQDLARMEAQRRKYEEHGS